MLGSDAPGAAAEDDQSGGKRRPLLQAPCVPLHKALSHGATAAACAPASPPVPRVRHRIPVAGGDADSQCGSPSYLLFKLRVQKGIIKAHGKRSCCYLLVVHSHQEAAQSEHQSECSGTAEEDFFIRNRQTNPCNFAGESCSSLLRFSSRVSVKKGLKFFQKP